MGEEVHGPDPTALEQSLAEPEPQRRNQPDTTLMPSPQLQKLRLEPAVR